MQTISPASAGVSPKRIRASSVRPAPTSPAKPRISPARIRKCTPFTPLSRQPRSQTSRTTSPSGTVRLGKIVEISRPTIRRIRSAWLSFRQAAGRHGFRRRASRLPDPRFDRVRRVGGRCRRYLDRAPAISLITRKRFSTSRVASDAVGSSMIKMRASAPRARAISTSCCSGMVRLPTWVSGSMSAPMRSRSCSCQVSSVAPVDSSTCPATFESQCDILRHAQIGKEGRLLVDGGDAKRARLTGSFRSTTRPCTSSTPRLRNGRR